MEETNHSLAEIAHSCGFADQSHFSRRFRSVMGRSPAVWRRERRSGVSVAELGSPISVVSRASAVIGSEA
jgi:AraC-like DNA-binding protein